MFFNIICATGLWAEGSGVIHTPRAGQMFFLPQQPFMPLGTLRQQLLFPSGVPECLTVEVRSADILQTKESMHTAVLHAPRHLAPAAAVSSQVCTKHPCCRLRTCNRCVVVSLLKRAEF